MGGHDRRGDTWDRNDHRGSNWNRGDRPRSFDRRSYQRNGWASRKFRGGYYRKPSGWYYRRWGYGQILPFAFFARDYWLNDYYAYDLPVPPYGYEWVRYGDDAILVDTRTGMILQVQYGVFY
jgi:Ni/Co efflux regulator RcnB